MTTTIQIDLREYNQRYYHENKLRILQKRKDKYKEDPEYRMKIQRNCQRHYRKRLKSRSKKIGYTIKKKGGMELFSLAFITRLTGKSNEDIWRLEKKGVIPIPLYTDAREWRLYTEDQVKRVATALERFDKGDWTIDEVRIYLHRHWKEETENDR